MQQSDNCEYARCSTLISAVAWYPIPSSADGLWYHGPLCAHQRSPTPTLIVFVAGVPITKPRNGGCKVAFRFSANACAVGAEEASPKHRGRFEQMALRSCKTRYPVFSYSRRLQRAQFRAPRDSNKDKLRVYPVAYGIYSPVAATAVTMQADTI